MDTPRPPAQEPEIIPPGQAHPRPNEGAPDMRVFVDFGAAPRARVVRLGPLGGGLLGLAIAVLAALVILLLIGAFLIWIPLAALFVAGALIAGFLRSHFRRH